MDPQPENITGEVIQRHSFEHQVDWSMLVIGLLGLFVAFKVASALESRDSEAVEPVGLRVE